MSTFFLQQLINGLTLGSVYGLIAIGYTMVYGIIGMINFAHGEVYMISAYLCAIGLALLSFFGLRCAVPVLIAIGGIRTRERPGHANHDICPGGKRRHQATGQHERKRSSDKFQRHYYVP